MGDKIARPSIDNIRSLGDFLSVYRWSIQFTFPSIISTESDSLNFRCTSVDVPKMTNSPVAISIRGFVVKQPGNSGVQNITLHFDETVNIVVLDFIKQWRDAIYNMQTGASKLPKNKLQGIVRLSQLDNQDKTVWVYKLQGVFLEDYDLGVLDGATSDIVKPSITLSYDYFTDGRT